MTQRFGVGIGNVACGGFGVHELLCVGDRGRVAEVIEVFAAYLGRAKEVDVRLGSLLVLTALGDAHCVNKEVKALLREVEAQVGIFLRHQQVVARIIWRYPRLLPLHLAEDLVHDVALHEGLLLDELVGCTAQLILVFGVDVDAEQQLGDRKCVSGIVEHQDLTGVFLVPEQVPRADVRLIDIL